MQKELSAKSSATLKQLDVQLRSTPTTGTKNRTVGGLHAASSSAETTPLASGTPGSPDDTGDDPEDDPDDDKFVLFESNEVRRFHTDLVDDEWFQKAKQRNIEEAFSAPKYANYDFLLQKKTLIKYVKFET